MPVRTSSARWNGSLTEGNGTMALGSGAFEGQFSFSSRFEEGTGTNPEELVAAAHAGCFSMAFSAGLGRAGFTPDYIETTAKVRVEKDEGGFTITSSELSTRGSVPGIDEATFQKEAEAAKAGCPVSRALAGVEISLDAQLV
jgi:osmotically inducible protein OsmC